MSDPKLETVGIHFMKRCGTTTTDWQRFEIFVHCSGTVAIEVGRLTHYTFRQQLHSRQSIAKLLVQLRESESSEHFGSYSMETSEKESEIKSNRIAPNQTLNDFLDQIIDQIEPRFQQQCRDILAWCSKNKFEGNVNLS